MDEVIRNEHTPVGLLFKYIDALHLVVNHEGSFWFLKKKKNNFASKSRQNEWSFESILWKCFTPMVGSFKIFFPFFLCKVLHLIDSNTPDEFYREWYDSQ